MYVCVYIYKFGINDHLITIKSVSWSNIFLYACTKNITNCVEMNLEVKFIKLVFKIYFYDPRMSYSSLNKS